LAGASPALGGAGDDTTVVAEEITAKPSGSTLSRTVNCPPGARALSGGIQSAIAPGASLQATLPLDASGLLAETLDGDIATRWASRVLNISGGTVGATGFALCSASADAVIRRKAFSTASEVEEAVSCAAGERALGGGVEIEGFTPAVIQASGPVDESGQWSNTDDGDVARAWRVSVRHHAGTLQAFAAFAICSATSQATVEANAIAIANGGSGLVSAVCPTGKRALGGGLGVVGDSSGFMGSTAPADGLGGANLATGSAAGGWRASVANDSGAPAPQTYKTYAICEGPATPGGGGGPAVACNGKPATITGTEGPDTLAGTPGKDVIAALGGADTVKARGGDDTVCGGAAADTLNGQGGKDRLLGEGGKDKLSGGGGKGDACTGGPGRDKERGSCEKQR
jgi:Ca2+-binding RTX toxin-like protein